MTISSNFNRQRLCLFYPNTNYAANRTAVWVNRTVYDEPEDDKLTVETCFRV